jgi:predicted DNA-binding transcriptional regulator AlpA
MAKKQQALKHALPKAAYSIAEFCQVYGISKGLYHKMKRAGEGPREIRIGSRVLISLEAAQAWNRARELESK